MDDYFMKRGHVPAFGSWDCEDTQLPFTQCFESARQAGLFHYAAYTDRDRDLYVAGDLYQNDHVVTPAMILVPLRRQARGCHQMPTKEGKKKQKWATETELNDPMSPTRIKHRPTPKPVDEDLYKISPDLLSSKPIKKKRTFGLFSSCLQPTCA